MTINETQDCIIREFSALQDWFDKYEYLIHLGKIYQSPIENIKIESNALVGCQSQVWICGRIENNRIRFLADSDSMIIRGILSLLLRALDDQTPSEVVSADLYFLKEIGLSVNLSPSRANGLASIVRQMRKIAES